jgi:hypothetical protein
MNAGTYRSGRRRLGGAVVSLVALLAFSPAVRAQATTRSPGSFIGVPAQAPRPISRLGGVKVQAPRPISGLGGVNAQAPRPISRLGGVRVLAPRPMSSLGGVNAQAPGRLNQRGTLLPPPPVSVQRDLGGRRSFPVPLARGGVVVDPRTGRIVGPSRPLIPGGMPSTSAGDTVFMPSGDLLMGSSGVVGIAGSGLTVDGSVRDDHFRLRFHLGSGLTGLPLFGVGNDHLRVCRFPFLRSWAYPYVFGYGYGYGGYGYRRYYDDYPPLVYSGYTDDPYVSPMPGTPGAQAAGQLTPLERADLALAGGNPHEAVKLYRRYLAATPDDGAATRSLAVALIQDRMVAQSTAVMALAYEKDATLVSQPINPNLIRGGEAKFRSVVLAAVHYANRVNSASAFLTVAVLMQAEGREATARTMLQKAKDLGLDAALAAKLEAAMMP